MVSIFDDMTQVCEAEVQRMLPLVDEQRRTEALRYKHLFGENYTASAMGVYAAAHCLAQGMVPDCLHDDSRTARCFKPCAILLVNQMDQQEYSLILLTKI